MAEGVEYKLLTRGVGAPGETLASGGLQQPSAPPVQLSPGGVTNVLNAAPNGAPPQKAPNTPVAPTPPASAPLAPSATSQTSTYVSGGAAIGIALGSLLVGGVLGWLMRGAAR